MRLKPLVLRAAIAGLTAAATPALADTVVSGPNGSVAAGSRSCVDGLHVDRCAANWSYTSPAGETWSGNSAVAVGPYRGAAYRTVTTPSGDTLVRGVRWRR